MSMEGIRRWEDQNPNDDVVAVSVEIEKLGVLCNEPECHRVNGESKNVSFLEIEQDSDNQSVSRTLLQCNLPTTPTMIYSFSISLD